MRESAASFDASRPACAVAASADVRRADLLAVDASARRRPRRRPRPPRRRPSRPLRAPRPRRPPPRPRPSRVLALARSRRSCSRSGPRGPRTGLPCGAAFPRCAGFFFARRACAAPARGFGAAWAAGAAGRRALRCLALAGRRLLRAFFVFRGSLLVLATRTSNPWSRSVLVQLRGPAPPPPMPACGPLAGPRRPCDPVRRARGPVLVLDGMARPWIPPSRPRPRPSGTQAPALVPRRGHGADVVRRRPRADDGLSTSPRSSATARLPDVATAAPSAGDAWTRSRLSSCSEHAASSSRCSERAGDLPARGRRQMLLSGLLVVASGLAMGGRRGARGPRPPGARRPTRVAARRRPTRLTRSVRAAVEIDARPRAPSRPLPAPVPQRESLQRPARLLRLERSGSGSCSSTLGARSCSAPWRSPARGPRRYFEAVAQAAESAEEP